MAYLSCVRVLVQTIPALTAAAHELLQRFPPKDCKTPVEVSHRLLSPRGGRGLRSPGRTSDRSDSQAAACSQISFHCLYACFVTFDSHPHAYTLLKQTVHLHSFIPCGVYLPLSDYINAHWCKCQKSIQNIHHKCCKSLPFHSS